MEFSSDIAVHWILCWRPTVRFCKVEYLTKLLTTHASIKEGRIGNLNRTIHLFSIFSYFSLRIWLKALWPLMWGAFSNQASLLKLLSSTLKWQMMLLARLWSHKSLKCLFFYCLNLDDCSLLNSWWFLTACCRHKQSLYWTSYPRTAEW